MDRFVTKQARGKPDGREQDSPTKQKVSLQHDQNRHVTRDVSRNMQKIEREKYLSMPLTEKRKLYRCGKDFVTLDLVKTWDDYFKENHKRIVRSKAKGGKKPMAEVNEDFNKKMSLWRGDITQLEIDAIVNAANESLLGGGGVDGAIHRAAGSKLKQECVTLQGCDTGDAKITCGYKLPAKYVIHTVGPIGEKHRKLESCYKTCLKLVKDNDLRSVAFCCISTGIYGYPNENAAPLAIRTVREWLEDGNGDLVDRIIFCLFLPVDVELYDDYMQVYFPANTPPPEEGDGKEEETEDNKKSVKSTKKSSPEKKSSSAAESTEDAEMDEPVHKKPLSDSVITRAKVPESPQANESRLKHSKTDCNKEKTKGQNETGNSQLKANETETNKTDKNEPMEEGEPHDTRQRHPSDMETAESKL